MKTYGLIQFRISSMLFTYPHTIDLNSFIILQSMSLTHTWSGGGGGMVYTRECRYTQHILKVHPGDFVPAQSATDTRSGRAGGTREQAWALRRIEKSLPWCISNPEPSSPKGLIKATPGSQIFSGYLKANLPQY
jgi:hypothetical protein